MNRDMLKKYMHCKRLKSFYPCAYHGSLVAMSDAATARDAEAYITAYANALASARSREILALTPGARKRDLTARVALVGEVHKRFGKVFRP